MVDVPPPDLLQQHQIPDLPPDMFYIPNFISQDEEQRILEKVIKSIHRFSPDY